MNCLLTPILILSMNLMTIIYSSLLFRLKMLMKLLNNQAELFGPFDVEQPAKKDSDIYSSAKHTIDISKHLDLQMKILAQLRHSRDLISKK